MSNKVKVNKIIEIFKRYSCVNLGWKQGIMEKNFEKVAKAIIEELDIKEKAKEN